MFMLILVKYIKPNAESLPIHEKISQKR